MKAATGRDIVCEMIRLGTNINNWSKQYATKSRIVNRLDELGLTYHQLNVLGFLHSHPELDTVSALSTELHISKGSLSLMLSKLQQTGFVEKKAAAGGDDGRKVYVFLTEKGKSAVQEIMDLLIENASVVFDRMEEERRTLIYAKVKELIELFDVGGQKA